MQLALPRRKIRTHGDDTPKLTRWRVAVTILVVFIIMVFTWSLEVLETERIELERRSNVLNELSTIRGKLEEALNTRLFLMQGVMASVAINPDMDATEFQALARVILDNEQGIRSIQLAKDSVVTHVYPLAGNEQALGLRLLDLPLQRPAVERALQSRTTVVAGPVDLVQGGTAFISRTPIYLKSSSEQNADSLYWGMATVVISQDSLFKEAGLVDGDSDIQIVVRGKDGLGAQGEIFFGDIESWNVRPVILEVNLPNGSWQLAAIPKGGWVEASPRIWWLRAGGITVASVTGILLWFVFSYQLRAQESEKRFRLIMNNSLDAVISMDEEGIITDWNLQAVKMFGWSHDEALGNTLVSTIIPARFHDRHKLGVKQFLSTGKKTILDQRIEIHACHKDGYEFPIELAVIAIRVHDSYVFNASIRDISQQKQTANELQKEKELLAVTLRSIGDGVITTNTHGEIVTVNNLAEKVTGWSEQEVVNRPLSEVFTIINERDREPCENPLDKVSRTGRSFDLPENCILVTRDGSERFVSDSCAPIRDRDNTIIGVVIVFRDVTDRKMQEQQRESLQLQLQQSQRMETVGTMAGGIAHDFNNILSPILGYSEMSLWDLPEESRHKDHIRQIMIAAKRAQALVQQILTFSSQESLERIPLRIGEIIQETVKLMRATLPTTIDIEEDIDVEAGVLIANPTQIGQIAVNLITNAYHAMPTGGTLSVEVKAVIVDNEFLQKHPSLKQANTVKLSISDTGHGMEPSIQSRIFEPFFTTKGPGGGSGLGLAVIHGIVRDSGGTIEVSSTLKKGTTFEVYLPESTVEELASYREEPRVGGGDETILIVDDEEAIVVMVKEMLERYGYTVSSWTRADEALNAFRDDPDRYDLVISDQTMPQVNGVEFSKALFAIRPGIPIILMTGFSETVNKDTALTLGIQDFIMKPVLSPDLNASIRNILDR